MAILDFVKGKRLRAAQLNSLVDAVNILVDAVNATVTSPIGSIVAWHKNLAGTPVLDTNWVECNGQTLVDSDSVYDGVVIPDLNGDGRFLRGSSTSGTEEAEAFKAHIHREVGGSGVGGENKIPRGASGTPFGTLNDTQSTGGSETRPINMSVVWIIRIK